MKFDREYWLLPKVTYKALRKTAKTVGKEDATPPAVKGSRNVNGGKIE